MTEVPEKETEGAPRRRRSARVTRDERPQVEEPTEEHAGNLVALPGERLSRAVEVRTGTDLDGEEDDEAALAADGQRRRTSSRGRPSSASPARRTRTRSRSSAGG